MRRLIHRLPLLAVLPLSMLAAGCDDDDSGGISAPPPAPAPTPSPTPTPAAFNVQPCFDQQVAPGVSVASLVIPDTITIDLSQPAGFPNGRRLEDQVIDVTLAVIFLDLTRHSARTFADIPLNPGGNDVPFPGVFPFVPPPQGNPPLSPTTGVNFNFRTDPVTAFTRVDRAGMPAVATALISGPNKNEYNDDAPVVDVTGKWVPEIASVLTGLTTALADDLVGLGLTPCATPN